MHPPLLVFVLVFASGHRLLVRQPAPHKADAPRLAVTVMAESGDQVRCSVAGYCTGSPFGYRLQRGPSGSSASTHQPRRGLWSRHSPGLIPSTVCQRCRNSSSSEEARWRFITFAASDYSLDHWPVHSLEGPAIKSEGLRKSQGCLSSSPLRCRSSAFCAWFSLLGPGSCAAVIRRIRSPSCS
jgi:hypothetical protein